jgi:hypothetical protein
MASVEKYDQIITSQFNGAATIAIHLKESVFVGIGRPARLRQIHDWSMAWPGA